MIEFQPFRAGHLTYLTPQEAQRKEHTALVASGRADTLEGPLALSAWEGSVCVGAAGCIAVWPHRAMGWLILSNRAAPYMLPIARKVRRVFAASPYKRIELTVADTFDAGHRFARLIGGVRETPGAMRFYGFDGGDEVMYALIKD